MAKGEREPGLPIKWHPVSNGEFLPPPPTRLVREATRRSLAALDENARRTGVDRRQFLLTACGSATMLAVLAACSKDEAKRNGERPGGTFDIPDEATTEPAAAEEAIGGDELIFDVQTHLLEYPEGSPPSALPGFSQSDCGLDDPVDCYRRPTFLDLMFLESDTSAIVLSAIPFPGDLLSPEVMAETIRIGEELCGDGRVFMQAQTNPSAAPVAQLRESMAQIAEDFPITAWKAYCHAGGPGWFLDDHDPSAPQVGEAFLAQAEALGVPRVAVHKGFTAIGGTVPDAGRWSDPVDVGPAAAAHPDLDLIVYHSGFDVGPTEGAYDPDNSFGVDRLIRSVREAGIEPGGNVYAELGSTWRFVMSDPTAAAHVLGKLLVHVGPDNVLWGTDSIWYGSPQDQIESFRAFTISEEFQERYGYPALTPEVKAKVLGLNAAALHGLDPAEGRCRFDAAELQETRVERGRKNQTYGPETDRAVRLLQARGEPWERLGA
ncbi:MAG: amidohydrolase family protein [Acidimicrobiales bacterium]|nr:amidohydrolase family protein [Acidimicrobiales bacterium]